MSGQQHLSSEMLLIKKLFSTKSHQPGNSTFSKIKMIPKKQRNTTSPKTCLLFELRMLAHKKTDLLVLLQNFVICYTYIKIRYWLLWALKLESWDLVFFFWGTHVKQTPELSSYPPSILGHPTRLCGTKDVLCKSRVAYDSHPWSWGPMGFWA